MSSASQYMYGQGSEFEYQRLIRQSAIFEAMTRDLLVEAGIGAGMRVLDIGCGVGEVARLASELVGTGRVVAVDTDSKALEFARERLAGRNIEFVCSEIAKYVATERFDAVVGRFILMHLKDPVAVLRHVAGQVRPGGIVCFIEPWHETAMSYPRVEAFQQFMEGGFQAMRAAGVHLEMGASLYSDFVAAGLPAPKLVGVPQLWGGGQGSEFFDLMLDSARSGIRATVPEAQQDAVLAQVEALSHRMRKEAAEKRATVMMMITVGARCRLA